MTEPTPTHIEKNLLDVHLHRLELPFAAKSFDTSGSSPSRVRDVAQAFRCCDSLDQLLVITASQKRAMIGDA
jgi:hypothetical protein